MSIRKRINLLVIILTLPAVCSHIHGYSRTSKTNSKGMQITAVQADSFRYVQAELIFDLKNGAINSAIPMIVMENLFNRKLPAQGSSLLNQLTRLGNNIKITYRQNHIRLSLKFLHSNFNSFLMFMKELYTYKQFKPERFASSKKKFWELYFARQNWLDNLAEQVAYNHFFEGDIIGRQPVSMFDAENANFYQLLSFFHETIKPSCTRIYIKSKMNPHIVYGHIENSMRNIKERFKRKIRQKRISVKSGSKLFVINSSRVRTPVVYTFKTVPPVISRKHLPEVLINTIDFGIPSGRVYRAALNGGVGNISISTAINNHRYFSVVRNSILRLQPSELSYVINLIHNISKNSSSRVKPGREEFLRALKISLGKERVKTAEYGNDLEREINILRFRSDVPVNVQTAPQTDSLHRISYTTLSRALEKKSANKPGEIYIVAGNGEVILRYLKKYNPTVINFPGS